MELNNVPQGPPYRGCNSGAVPPVPAVTNAIGLRQIRYCQCPSQVTYAVGVQSGVVEGRQAAASIGGIHNNVVSLLLRERGVLDWKSESAYEIRWGITSQILQC